jgi:LuxR family maltose regulon positive regulatory protein
VTTEGQALEPDAPAGGPVLLATKLHPPPPHGDAVARPALEARLSAGLSRRFTLVDAPAGWGKTTLVGRWREHEAGRGFAWVSLDNGDNDPVRFWTYLVEALRTVEPDLGSTTLALVRNPGTSILEVALPILLNETAAAFDDQVVLVLDDYHVIENGEIHEAVAYLIEHLPPTLHLVISTRFDPPFALPRLRARGEMAEIRAEELRFTEEETTALLNDVLRLGLAPEDVSRLQERAEGWVAGLYLAALSLQGRTDPHQFIADFAGDERHIVDYLGAEVLDRQPEELRTFLLDTSVIDRMCGPVCDAVTGGAGSASRLEEIERSNLFLVPLDTKRQWYRYHRLFRQLLRHELEIREPGRAPTLHRRAAEWHQAQGAIPEAIDHALAAGAADDAADLVAGHWNTLFNQGALATVSGWLDALGEAIVFGDPGLCIARAWIAMDLGLLEEVGRWTQAAARTSPGRLMPDGSSADSAVALLRLVASFKVGDLKRSEEAAGRALELEPEASAFGRVVVHLLVGVTRYWRGDTAAARPALEEAAALAGQTHNELGAIYALGYLAVLHAEAHDVDEAEAFVARGEKLGEDPARAEHFVSMMIHLARGLVHEQRGDPMAAEGAIARAAELSRRGAGRLETAGALLTLARIRHDRGDTRGARQLLDEVNRLTRACPDPGILPGMLLAADRRPRMVAHSPAGDSRPALEELSERELDVLRLMASPLSQREIADQLYLSLNTVKTHRKHIFRKLEVSTRAQAVGRARQLGLV